jgi:hypothetical protein
VSGREERYAEAYKFGHIGWLGGVCIKGVPDAVRLDTNLGTRRANNFGSSETSKGKRRQNTWPWGGESWLDMSRHGLLLVDLGNHRRTMACRQLPTYLGMSVPTYPDGGRTRHRMAVALASWVSGCLAVLCGVC